MQPVKYSIFFYDMSAHETIEAAVACEALGFDVVWLAEHVLLPAGYSSEHPGDHDQPEATKVAIDGDSVLLDQWTMAGAIFARTSRIRFGPAVHLVPLRHPLLTARSATTAESISAGRLLFGAGSGWMREEFDVLGVPFEERGRRLDESLEIMRLAWSGKPFAYEGRFWQFPAVQVTTEPVSVPLVVGGNSRLALRRAARIGDGWFNSGSATMDELIAARDLIQATRREFGRSEIPFTFWTRPESLDQKLSEELARVGFVDQVLWGRQLWPIGSHMTIEEKKEHMAAAVAQFGLGRDV